MNFKLLHSATRNWFLLVLAQKGWQFNKKIMIGKQTHIHPTALTDRHPTTAYDNQKFSPKNPHEKWLKYAKKYHVDRLTYILKLRHIILFFFGREFVSHSWPTKLLTRNRSSTQSPSNSRWGGIRFKSWAETASQIKKLKGFLLLVC